MNNPTPETIIILNGTSSSGKSSLCRAFQAIAHRPFMHMDVDAVAEMLPPNYFGEDDSRWAKVRRFQNGFHKAVCRFSETGHPVIVDQIVVRHGLMQFILENYDGFPVYFIGLICPLEELERREIARKIQPTGLARRQNQGIHLNKVYDLELDTHQFASEICAEQLKQHIQNHPPFAFDQLRTRLARGGMIGKEDRQ